MEKVMEELKKRKNTIRAFGMFLVFMFICTIVSKGVYASGLPQVETQVPQEMSLVHYVSVEGSVRQGKEIAINILSGLRIEEILVREGDKVEEGTVLLIVDTADLREQIQTLEKKLNRLGMQIEDLKKNQEIQEQQKSTEIQRAKEDYENTQTKMDRNITQAEEILKRAQEALKQHENSPVKQTSEEERKKQEKIYKDWLEKKNELEEALEEAMQEMTDAQLAYEELLMKLETAKAQGENPENIEILQKQVDEAKIILEEKTTHVEESKVALEKHTENPVEKPDYSDEDVAKEEWDEKRAQLQKEVEVALSAKTEAGYAKESEMQNAQRMLADAEQPLAKDSTLSIYELDYQSQEESLEEYKKIASANGKICAEQNGMIVQLNAAVGERTTDSPIVKIADTEHELEFQTTINEEQKKYMNTGVGATIHWNNGGKEDVKIDYLVENHAISGKYDVTIILPKGVGDIGQSGILEMAYKSPIYSVCIPLNAIYIDGNQRKFVYVMSKKESILGEELTVQKVYVEIIEQNDQYAALKEGLIDHETEIVILATKDLEEGKVVRYKEW